MKYRFAMDGDDAGIVDVAFQVQIIATDANRDSERIPRGLSERSRDPAHRGRGEGSISGDDSGDEISENVSRSSVM